MASKKLTYTTKSGVVQYMPRLKWITSVVEGDNSEGFCLACGATQGCVEPDARKYTCEACKAPKVYGAEELLMMGFGR